MKKIQLILLLAIISLTGYGQMNFYCDRNETKSDSMTRAWYPYQIVDSIVFDEKNLIIADINNKPTNFISSEEQIKRSLASVESHSKDFFEKYESDEFDSYEAYLKDLNEKSTFWDSLAVLEHQYSNSMDMAVWIQNQTNDTILFPIQDGSLIGVIEANDKNGNWKPIQYWWFSWCGNSYEDLILPPKKSIQIGLNNRLGKVDTKMRLRIHGRDTIYLSNEFLGKISNNAFTLNNRAKKEMLEDKERISFLDSIHHGLTVFPDPPEIIIKNEE